MAEFTHSEQCKQATADREVARARWVAEWPNYCRTCDGWGGAASSYDPSPAGVCLSSGSMEDWDSCPACTDNGICSRCGAESPIDEDAVEAPACAKCGADGTDGMPPPYEDCGCWYEQEKEIEQQLAEYDRMLDQQLAD